jgi:L-lysine exporter family protein LysE/ArgO
VLTSLGQSLATGSTQSLAPALSGFGFGLSLLIAIGAQNAFVLRQGIARASVPLVVAVCAVSDIALILAGVAGIGAVTDRAPWAVDALAMVGALFLAGYGTLAARRVLRPSAMSTGAASARSATATFAMALALTWLNPHVYLDTVVLLGSVSGTYGDARWIFALGACISSVVWFATLGFGARYLSGLFERSRAWQILDAIIAVVMWSIAASLVHGLMEA